MNEEFWRKFNAVVLSRDKYNLTYSQEANEELELSANELIRFCQKSETESVKEKYDKILHNGIAEFAMRYCEEYEISLKQMRGPRRSKEFYVPRQKAMAHAMHSGRFTSSQVGRFFNRDHTTVLHAMKAFPASCFKE